MTDCIDHFIPDPTEAAYVSILTCTVCGERGRMYSTAEPRAEQYWDCEACGTEMAAHEITMMTNGGVEVKQ